MLKVMPKLLVAVVLAVAVAGTTFAATSKVRVISNSGTLTYKDKDGNSHPFKSGQRLPEGATLTITGGTAVLRIGGQIVKLGDGDSVSVGKGNELTAGGNAQISKVEASTDTGTPGTHKAPPPGNQQNLKESVSPSSPH